MYAAQQTSVSANIPRAMQNSAAPVISLTGAQQNELLRALSREELVDLFVHLDLVPLEAGKRLFDAGATMEYAWFPTNAIVSLQYMTEDGGAAEVAVVGREGVVGVAMYENERANCSAVVQSAGYGYRIKTSVLRQAFFSGGALAQQLMRHTSALFAQLAQTVAGVRHGSIEQRLCRWLLERLDRSLSNELKVTQEMIANMLGVRRESITCCAGKLQEEGLIEYRRGTVIVLDRHAMERRAGGCYSPA
ncbi:helix-turn-helix domain-containing protein [Duganella sp. FT80W]|uniref:Helix-turn-helix domain-containing protein n=1 Tax=Duganella guangzhouensis TaxID=2666084 RepID=A0A6I2KWT4_9BURK|nr:Crp/Fnr family transcriptional regulator [Duganella guangzhouensis]MRW90458.1 helix-turn-helix domain-containing protein [Duganella guangzhouensis]